MTRVRVVLVLSPRVRTCHSPTLGRNATVPLQGKLVAGESFRSEFHEAPLDVGLQLSNRGSSFPTVLRCGHTPDLVL